MKAKIFHSLDADCDVNNLEYFIVVNAAYYLNNSEYFITVNSTHNINGFVSYIS